MCGLAIVLVLTTDILHTRYKRYNKRTFKIWTLLLLISQILALLQRPLGSTIVLFTPLLLELLTFGDSSSQWIRLTIVYFLGHYLFFVTGHQATFTSLPWKAAFIGFDGMNYYGGMILVTLSTLAGYIMSWIGWSYLASTTESTQLLLAIFQSVPTFFSAIFIFVLKRHLMTWKIFAPRFLLQVLLELGVHVVISFL
jgi:phosphatidylinositol glycan class O